MCYAGTAASDLYDEAVHPRPPSDAGESKSPQVARVAFKKGENWGVLFDTLCPPGGYAAISPRGSGIKRPCGDAFLQRPLTGLDLSICLDYMSPDIEQMLCVFRSHFHLLR